jgi:hypothetical protein
MERNPVSWWPVVDGVPSPLSTDIEEITIYMPNGERQRHPALTIRRRGAPALNF